MDASASASVAHEPRIANSNGAQFRRPPSRAGCLPRQNGRPATGLPSGAARAGKAAPSGRQSFLGRQGDGDQERTGRLAAALIELGYSVDFARDGDAKLATILADRPSVVFCVCSTARLSDLGLLEQFSEASSERHALPPVLLMGQSDSECASRRVGADDGGSRQRPLTVREKDVLTWVARGKTSAEIAIILGLSERTINFHCDKAMKRLDVINRTQAVAKAIAEGLIGI
ncbi:MAG: hypothetical protein JOZ17_24460 [Acetobacteraceae bacterium]|nr:hypothetical protein [Acetobacteraceae bacterium]